MGKFLTGLFLTVLAVSGLEAKAETSTHTITVDRVFSARPRSMSYRYLVSITCQAAGENIIQTPARNASFGWKVGNQMSSSATDSNGRSEFTQTAFDGNLAETLEIVYQGKRLIFTAAHGLQQVPVNQACR
jgi:hypothetical protein